jgi:hypothetical protein
VLNWVKLDKTSQKEEKHAPLKKLPQNEERTPTCSSDAQTPLSLLDRIETKPKQNNRMREFIRSSLFIIPLFLCVT